MNDSRGQISFANRRMRKSRTSEFCEGRTTVRGASTRLNNMLKMLDHIKVVFEDGTLLVVIMDGTEIECKNEEE